MAALVWQLQSSKMPSKHLCLLCSNQGFLGSLPPRDLSFFFNPEVSKCHGHLSCQTRKLKHRSPFDMWCCIHLALTGVQVCLAGWSPASWPFSSCIRSCDSHLTPVRVECKKVFWLQKVIHQPKVVPKLKSEGRESKGGSLSGEMRHKAGSLVF